MKPIYIIEINGGVNPCVPMIYQPMQEKLCDRDYPEVVARYDVAAFALIFFSASGLDSASVQAGKSGRFPGELHHSIRDDIVWVEAVTARAESTAIEVEQGYKKSGSSGI
jgi:hypothetical protein